MTIGVDNALVIYFVLRETIEMTRSSEYTLVRYSSPHFYYALLLKSKKTANINTGT